MQAICNWWKMNVDEEERSLHARMCTVTVCMLYTMPRSFEIIYTTTTASCMAHCLQPPQRSSPFFHIITICYHNHNNYYIWHAAWIMSLPLSFRLLLLISMIAVWHNIESWHHYAMHPFLFIKHIKHIKHIIQAPS